MKLPHHMAGNSRSKGKTQTRVLDPQVSMVAYAMLALISLLMALAVGWWLAAQADLLGVRFERAYYVLLVVLGLASALMLFGAMRSTATVRGQHLGVAFDVGGPAALFVLVVVGGGWLTQPASSFNTKVRLSYASPAAYRAAYDAALDKAKLRVQIGNATNDYEVSNQGEVIIWDTPGRFRDGHFSVELLSDSIHLLEPDGARRILFPGPDEVVELKAALNEPPDRRAAREDARAALAKVIAAVQKALMRQDNLLFPAIDDFLDAPSDLGFERVKRIARQTQAEVQSGIDVALAYDAQWGGLLGVPQEVRNHLASETRLPSQLGDVVQSQQGRDVILDRANDPDTKAHMVEWRERLRSAYQRTFDALKPLVDKLTPPA